MKVPFFRWLEEHLQKNEKAVVLFCDLGFPYANHLLQKFPERALNMGVTEQNLAVVAKGLTSEGFEVFVYGVSSFTLWRAAEAWRLYFNKSDRLRIIGNGGGLGYGLMGTSHHALDDLGLVHLWPGWTSWTPRVDEQVQGVLAQISLASGPHYLRLINNPSRHDFAVTQEFPDFDIFGTAQELFLMTQGPVADEVLKAVGGDPEVGVIVLKKWPLSYLGTLQSHLKFARKIIFVEEHLKEGSLMERLPGALKLTNIEMTSLMASKQDVGGTREYLLELNGLTQKNIAQRVLELKNRE